MEEEGQEWKEEKEFLLKLYFNGINLFIEDHNGSTRGENR